MICHVCNIGRKICKCHNIYIEYIMIYTSYIFMMVFIVHMVSVFQDAITEQDAKLLFKACKGLGK